MDVTKAVQHLPQVTRTAIDVLGGIMSVANAELASGCWH
jgi:hypothetical protein